MKTRVERLVVIFACVFVAVRVFVFSAGFPLFCNVDEPGHFDCVWRVANGWLIAGLEKYEPEAVKLVSTYQTREYIYDPKATELATAPPTWLLEKREAEKRISEEIGAGVRVTNIEGVQPPLYYLAAGMWYRIGLAGGFSPFWIRFLNVGICALLVWLAYWYARNLYPDRAFIRLGLPILVAFVPQDLFYSINNGVLSPVLFGAAFCCLVMIALGRRESLWFYTMAGLLTAGALLNQYTNAPIYVVLAVTVLGRLRAARRENCVRREAIRLGVLVLAATLPIAAWFARNYLTIGAPTALGQFVHYAEWTVKPFGQIWQHPVFSAHGANVFLNELMTRYFRGEFRWHGHPLGSAVADAFYAWSPVIFLLYSAASCLATRAKENLSERFADCMAWVVVVASVAALVVMSIRYEFGDWAYPSHAHPYYAHGRLMYGTMLPFFALYLRGMDYMLWWLKLEKVRYVALAGICALMLASEILISTGVFTSQFNWFHLIAAGKHP